MERPGGAQPAFRARTALRAAGHSTLNPSSSPEQPDFHRLFLSDPVPRWIYDRRSLRFLEVNEAAVASYGWSRETFLRMTLLDIRRPEDREAVLRTTAGARPISRITGPWRHLDAAGNERLVRIVSQWIRFGERDAVLASIWNITDEVRSQEALRQHDEWLRLTQDAGEVGSWEWNCKTGQLQWSESCHRIYGTDPSRPVDSGSWLRTVYPEDRAGAERKIRDLLAGEALEWEMDYRLLRASDGEVRWAAVRGKIIREPKTGRALRARGIVLDVTERKLSEAFAAGESVVLEMVARGSALKDVLAELCRVAEAQLPGSRCSVLLHDPERGTLHLGAAPSLPSDYNAAIDGIVIGPEVGCCGAAAFCKHRVVASDIASDARWAAFREAALACGLHSCWSEPILTGDGEVLGTFAIYYDTPRAPGEAETARLRAFQNLAAVVIERHQAEASLRESEEFSRSVLESSLDCVKILNLKGQLLFMNGPGMRLLDIEDFGAIRGQSWPALLPEPAASEAKRAITAARKGQSARFISACPTVKGLPKWWDILVSPVRGADGQVVRLLAVSRDVTELRRKEEELRATQAEALRLALYDPLTGLANRRLLDDEAPGLAARARRNGAALCALAIDLDRFKPVNDLHGHAAGDVVLREVAERLRTILREQDLAARMGGDEFAVLVELEGVSSGAAAQRAASRLAQRILSALTAPIPLDGGEAAIVGASIGVSLATPQEAVDHAVLLRQADAALYRAKAEGRGAFRFHELGMDAVRRARARTEADLRRAIAAGQIEPHYQPLVNLRSGCLEGFEVLARWQHPERGLVLPGDFIPVAEDAGLIGPLTEVVLRRAASDAALWQRPLPIAVNFSALLLHDATLPARVLRILSEAGLSPNRLEVEVTETAIVADPDRARRTASALKAAGVRFSMDDFGTGHSSLASLRTLPFDRVKIDRGFVSRLGNKDNESEVVVAAIVALSRSFGLETVAEGIEDETTARLAAAVGCDIGQGWYFGRPTNAADVASLAAEVA